VGSAMLAAENPARQRLGFTAASKEADRVAKTHEGHDYMIKFTDAMDRSITAAMTACTGITKETVRYDLVFVISANGRIEHVLAPENNRVATCMVQKLTLVQLPPPPRAPWYQAIGLVNQVDPKPGPPDRPVRVTGDDVAAYNQSISPYERRGRATYPSAKQRFLRGLPPNHKFSVRVRFYGKDRARYEDAFVKVESIKSGKIYGTIVVKMNIVTERQEGEHVVIPESDVRDWLILRPDGTEEGNYVGKFLDHYNPKK
jgi:uncharacterized protein YegJ (DUF2314 family)